MSHHFWPYAIDADEAPPLDADRYLVWLARHQWRTILGGVLFGVPWMLSIALVPAAIGKAIDGLVAHDEKALLVWSGAIMGLGLVSAVTTDGRHWFAVRNWLIASFRTAVVTERAVRRAGPALTRRMPAGEVVTSFASDFWRIGNAYDVTARMAGAIVSFVVVSVILLRGSVAARRHHARRRPGAARLAHPRHAPAPAAPGRPAGGGRPAHLARRRHRRRAARAARHRRRGHLPAPVRRAVRPGAQRGVQLSGIQATLDAAQVLLPGIFVVIVTGVGAHLAVAGEITPGQLVAFYGYTAFLTMPLRTATEFVDKMTRARVGARRIVHDPGRRARPRRPPRPARPSTATSSTSAPRSSTRSPASSSSRAGSPRWSAPAPRRPPRWPTGWAAPGPAGTACAGARSRSTTSRWMPCAARRGVRGRPAPVQRAGARGPGRGQRRGPPRGRVGHQRLRRPRRARARHGRRARGARPGPLGRPAPAPRPGPRPAARPRGARAHRAHQRRRRPHRGPDRRAAGRAPGRVAPRCSSPRARCCSTTPTPSCSSRAAG